eukprot:7901091-Alexandrium_andersonii.AAC.1
MAPGAQTALLPGVDGLLQFLAEELLGLVPPVALCKPGWGLGNAKSCLEPGDEVAVGTPAHPAHLGGMRGAPDRAAPGGLDATGIS